MAEDDPVDTSRLTDDERMTLTYQLSRLNKNLETQQGLITAQLRRRWRIVFVVLALVVLGIARVETNRQNDDRRFRQVQKEQARSVVEAKHKQCEASNAVRAEIRVAFDRTFLTIQQVAPEARKADVVELAKQVHDGLAQILVAQHC
jgi:hypothetical protein